MGSSDERGSPAPNEPAFAAPCIDCPAARIGSFQGIVGTAPAPCLFAKATLAARAPIPLAWAERHAFILVRRGALVRLRSDAVGEPTAIDCAGAGCYVALPSSDVSELGYAATDAMVCLCPRDVSQHFLVHDSEHAKDVVLGMASGMERLERFAFARGQATAERKVAALLAALADTLTPPRRRQRLPHGLQQRDLARLAGVRHESFCRVLGELERRGLVRRDREGLEILDHGGLALAA